MPVPVFAENDKYASFIMDADTGLVLYQRDANKKLHPASLTKVMTLLMVFDALEKGELNLTDRIPVSKHAAGMVPSKLDLRAGSSIRVKDAIYAIVTKSANDVAVALAEAVGGNEQNFARMMTRRAHQIGMTRTTFKNASGLHNPGQFSTARDMAIMAQTVINQYPKYYPYFSKRDFTYEGRSFHNHNRLMDTYEGMDGMKTGYVQASGFNLVASAVRNNHRIIGVVFGGRTARSRNAHMAGLLDNGFARLNEIRVAGAKAPLPPRKPGILLALNTLNKINPGAGEKAESEKNSGGEFQKWALANPALQGGMFSEIIGEGDYDPAARQRIETGLIAIAAHTGQMAKQQSAKPPTNSWAIQIGAFTSRAATDQAIRDTLDKLPSKFADGNPVIAPLKIRDGWLFRGRIAGYTKGEAFTACSHLSDCLPVAPYN